VILAISLAAAAGAYEAPFTEGRAPFSVRARGETIPYELFGLFVLPGDPVDVAVVEAPWRQAARLEASWDGLVQTSPGAWRGRAPTHGGLHTLRVVSGGASIELRFVVMVPASESRDGTLRGYRIGSYPSEAFRGLETYRPPRGFVEVTAHNADLRVSPHFTLGQFLCKQEAGGSRFVVLRERMLLKLEQLLALVNAGGLRTDTFFVMSGYRTPVYNAAIGNVRYSRHQYGDAADIFIDENPRDGVMDDLNGDGRVNDLDGHYLYDLFDATAEGPFEATHELVGGLGAYGTTAAHGPFVHVDTRGYRARWGR
jgi:hypothetical protein